MKAESNIKVQIMAVVEAAIENGFEVEVSSTRVEVTSQNQFGETIWNYSIIGENKTTEDDESGYKITLDRLLEVAKTGKFVTIQ